MAYNMTQRYIVPRQQGYDDPRSRAVRDLAGSMGQVSANSAGGLNYSRGGTAGPSSVRGLTDTMASTGARVYNSTATPNYGQPAAPWDAQRAPGFGGPQVGFFQGAGGPAAAPYVAPPVVPAHGGPTLNTGRLMDGPPGSSSRAGSYAAGGQVPPGIDPNAWYRPNDPSRPGDMTIAEAIARGYPVP